MKHRLSFFISTFFSLLIGLTVMFSGIIPAWFILKPDAVQGWFMETLAQAACPRFLVAAVVGIIFLPFVLSGFTFEDKHQSTPPPFPIRETMYMCFSMAGMIYVLGFLLSLFFNSFAKGFLWAGGMSVMAGSVYSTLFGTVLLCSILGEIIFRLIPSDNE